MGLLIDVKALEEGAFETMISTLRSSPFKNIIMRIIPALLITYEDNYLEADLGIIYTALEMLVYGLSTEQDRLLLPEDDFKKWQPQLKKSIKPILKDEVKLSSADRNDLYAKLGELNRRPYQIQLERVLGQHVDVSKFFPPLGNEDSSLRDLIDRRNEYVHQGRFDDGSITDFHRIRLLIEMTIFKLLGYPISRYNRLCDDLWYVMEHSLPEDYSFEVPESS
jgi:hypothetical protein